MRFPGDLVHRIRAGEVSITLRRCAGPTRLRVGTIRAIERVDDVRTEHEDGRVEYERKVCSTDEAIEITALRREVLDLVGDPVAAAAGFDSAAELVDAFRTDFGGPADQTIWVFEFQLAYARPLFLAQQNGLASPPQYTSNPMRAIDDAEVLEPATLEHYAKRGRARHARFQKKSLEQELRGCATPDERHRLLVARAREAGIDVRDELRSLERRLIQKIEKSAA